jgi:hypothetical protein
LISLQNTYTMPVTSRKRRGSLSPATLTQRAVSQNFPTALQNSRRKSKDVPGSVRDTEENLIDDERGILLSPGLLPRPPILANKTPFSSQISSQTAPQLHSSARQLPLFALQTPASGSNTSNTGIVGSNTLISSGLPIPLAGNVNRFSVNKSSSSGVGIAEQREIGEQTSRRSHGLLSSSSLLLKPTTSIQPFSSISSLHPLPISPSLHHTSSSPTGLAQGGVHSQFGLGSPLVIRPRLKHPSRYRFCMFVLLLAVVLLGSFAYIEHALMTSGKTGFVESFLTRIPSFSVKIVKLLDIDDLNIDKESAVKQFSLQSITKNEPQRDDLVTARNDTFLAELLTRSTEVVNSEETLSVDSLEINKSVALSFGRKGESTSNAFDNIPISIQAVEIVSEMIDENAASISSVFDNTSSTAETTPASSNDYVALSLELQNLKATFLNDLAKERESREEMMIAFDAKIKPSFEKCEIKHDQTASDMVNLQTVAEIESIAQSLNEVNEVKEQMTLQFKEAFDLVSQLKQQINSLNETSTLQLKELKEIRDGVSAAEERTKSAAENAAQFASQSATTSLLITAQLQNISQLRNTDSHSGQLNFASILSELQASFSLLNATVAKDLNAVLQRCEESVLMIDSNNIQADLNTEIDNRIDSLLSIVKETRTDLSNHASALESVRVIAVNSSKIIAEYELHELKSSSELNEMKIVVTSISKKVEEKEDKDESVLNSLKTLIADFTLVIDEVKQHGEKNDAALRDLTTFIATLSKKTEELSEKIDESDADDNARINLVHDELTTSIAALSKKIDEAANENETKKAAFDEVKTSISALHLKINEGKDYNISQSALFEGVKTSLLSLRADVTSLNASIVSLPIVPEQPLFNSSSIEAAIILNEVGIAQLRNESIWIEKRLREVVKTQKVHDAAISESLLEVGDTLEFLTETLFNQTLNITHLFDIFSQALIDFKSNYTTEIDSNTRAPINHQLSDMFLSDSRLLRTLRSASMPSTASISAAPFPQNLVRHTWADGTSLDGIAALAVSSGSLTEYVTLSDVATLIDLSLSMVAADHGVPLSDYALAQGGAEVVTHLTSTTWFPSDTILDASEEFIEDYKQASSPYNALQPSVSEGAGHCWPMAGSNGRLTVRLKTPIHVTAITIDHLPSSVAPVRPMKGSDDVSAADIASQLRSASAPKRFNIYSLKGDSDVDNATKTLLGSFTFDASNDAPPTQTFHLGKSIFGEGNVEKSVGGDESSKDDNECNVIGEEVSTPIIMLHVLDNHGHSDYTCIYRLRVHGYVVPNDSTK